MEHNLKAGLEKWKHVIAFVVFGIGVSITSSAVVSIAYRDVIQRQTESHQNEIRTLTEQLTLERGETRSLLSGVMARLDEVGKKITAISESVEEIALAATRMTGEAAATAKDAAGTAKSAAAAAKRAATSVREAVKELNDPPPPPPRKRRTPKEYIEP